MLVFTRKRHEAIMIGDGVEIRVLRVGRDGVRIGVSAPPSVSVHRREVYDQIREENRGAAQAVTAVEDLAAQVRRRLEPAMIIAPSDTRQRRRPRQGLAQVATDGCGLALRGQPMTAGQLVKEGQPQVRPDTDAGRLPVRRQVVQFARQKLLHQLRDRGHGSLGS